MGSFVVKNPYKNKDNFPEYSSWEAGKKLNKELKLNSRTKYAVTAIDNSAYGVFDNKQKATNTVLEMGIRAKIEELNGESEDGKYKKKGIRNAIHTCQNNILRSEMNNYTSPRHIPAQVTRGNVMIPLQTVPPQLFTVLEERAPDTIVVKVPKMEMKQYEPVNPLPGVV